MNFNPSKTIQYAKNGNYNKFRNNIFDILKSKSFEKIEEKKYKVADKIFNP